MSSTKSKVLCYGGIAIESIFKLPYQPKPGIAHIICEEHYRLGGGAANVAEWLGSWAIPTRISGYVIGYDHYGDLVWKFLSAFPSIDLKFLKRDRAIRTLIARSIPFPDGNTYLFCSDFASAKFTSPEPEMLEDIQFLEISFYYRNPRGNDASVEIARIAKTKGIKIVAMDIVSSDHETLPLADIIINSAASIIEQHPDVNIFEHSKVLQSISNSIMITTDGSQEINAIDHDGTHYSLLPPKVQVTDSTGAGDSFRAGIIYGHIKGWPLAQSLKWAAAVAALQVQRNYSQDQSAPINEIAEIANQLEVHQVS
jgi:sugar/nucleoside kinase (ribokinase family)